MNKPYLTAAIIATLFSSGCTEKIDTISKDPIVKEVSLTKPKSSVVEEIAPVKSNEQNPLGKSLEAILGNVSERLSQKEIGNSEYATLLFEQLKEQDILSGDYNLENAMNVGSFEVLIGRKLNIDEKIGVWDSYHIIDCAPLSKKAQQDIDSFNELSEGLGKYLKENIGNNPINEKDFESLSENYLKSHLPESIGMHRKNSVIGRLIARYETKFTLTSERDSNGYNRDAINRAMEQVEIK